MISKIRCIVSRESGGMVMRIESGLASSSFKVTSAFLILVCRSANPFGLFLSSRNNSSTVILLLYSVVNDSTGEERYRLEPVNTMDAEKLYERGWALTVLEQARERARQEYFRTGKAGLYQRLKGLDLILNDALRLRRR